MGLEKSLSSFGKKFAKAIAITTLSSILSSCPMEEPQKPKNPFEQDIDYETGGEITIEDENSFIYGTKLTIPTGSLNEDTTISIGLVNNPPPLPSGMNYVGAAIDIESSEKNLNSPITISIPYNDEWIIDAGLADDSELKAYSYLSNRASSGWLEVPFSLDALNKVISLTLSHFGYYSITGLMDNPPEELGSPKPGDLLYTLGAFWA